MRSVCSIRIHRQQKRWHPSALTSLASDLTLDDSTTIASNGSMTIGGGIGVGGGVGGGSAASPREGGGRGGGDPRRGAMRSRRVGNEAGATQGVLVGARRQLLRIGGTGDNNTLASATSRGPRSRGYHQ